MIATLVAFAGIAGFLLALVGLIRAIHPRRLSHEPLPPSRLPRIRLWRSKSFRYGLFLIQQYTDQILKRAETTSLEVSNQEYKVDDLRRWAYLVVLSCAACIVADSQSKSTLYRFTSSGNNHEPPTELGTFEFVGNIPLTRVAEGGFFREIGLSSGDLHGFLPVIRLGRPQLIRLIEKDLDENEHALGTTHILVIPIVRAMIEAERGTVAALTVDLRMGWFRSMLYDRGAFRDWSQLMKRAVALQTSVRDLVNALLASRLGQ